MGDKPHYTKGGELENTVVAPKYAGELELDNILKDQNYKVMGCCDISCISVYDTITEAFDEDRLKEVNKGIKETLHPKSKKTEVELLIEQNKILMEKLERKDKQIVDDDDDEPKEEENEELESLRKRYFGLYGKKPSHFMKEAKLKEKIALKLK